MTVKKRILSLLAETSVHAGTGAQLGAVDLPIQRERHTEWPTIYGTGLKGVLRDEAKRVGEWSESQIKAIFGPETDKKDGKEVDRHSGCLAISDARVLLFPVRTVGVAFAWVTCPLALARLVRDASDAGIDKIMVPDGQPTGDRVLVCPSYGDSKILLEEFEYDVQKVKGLDEFGLWVAKNLIPTDDAYEYWRQHAAKAIVVVCDDDFRDFVCHGTEVVTRVKLTGDKTVEKGMLWTEENLPSETLMYSFVVAWDPTRKADESLTNSDGVIKKLSELLDKCKVIQVGGKETVGRGFVYVRFAGGNHG